MRASLGPDRAAAAESRGDSRTLDRRGAPLKRAVAMKSIARRYRAGDSERVLAVEGVAGNRHVRRAANRSRVLEAHVAEGERACGKGDHRSKDAGLAEARRVCREAGRSQSGSEALRRAREHAVEISGCHLLGGSFGGGLVETKAGGDRHEMTVRDVG